MRRCVWRRRSRDGNERLIVVAETRERDRAAQNPDRTGHHRTSFGAIGMPRCSRGRSAKHNSKTSSGKLQRDARRNGSLRARLAELPPAWLQIARLAAASSFGRIRAALRRSMEVAYVATRGDVRRCALPGVVAGVGRAFARMGGTPHDSGTTNLSHGRGLARARRRTRAPTRARAANVRFKSHQLRGRTHPGGGARRGLSFRRQG